MDPAESSQNYSESQLFLQDHRDLVIDFVQRATRRLSPMVAKWAEGRQEITDEICQKVLYRVFKYLQHRDLKTTEDPLAVLKAVISSALKNVIQEWRRSVGAPDEDPLSFIEEFLEYQEFILRAAAQILNLWWLQCSFCIQTQKPTALILYPPLQKKKQRRQRKLSVAVVPRKKSSEDFSHSLNTQVITFINRSVVRGREIYARGIYTSARTVERRASEQ